MSQDEYTRLFAYMQTEFTKLHAALDSKAEKADTNRIYSLLDADLKAKEINEHERLAANHQLDRHEDWITQAAAKLNVRYDPSA